MAFEVEMEKHEDDDDFVIDDEFIDQYNIMVIGVGGGGGNAVSNMVEGGLSGIDYVVANTDVKALRSKDGSLMRRIQIGKKRTRGRGAGNDPQVGQESAEESRDELKEQMEEESLVFVAAGMGGGTGTGAAPVVASIAKELGKLTIGVVTKPFAFEGLDKMDKALKGIAEMQKYVDALVVIPNEKVKELGVPKLTVRDAFKAVDGVLFKAVKGISDLVKRAGEVNVDFGDVRMVLENSGIAHMAIAHAKGDNRLNEVVEQILHSPLLETSISGARRLLLNISLPEGSLFDDMETVLNNIAKNVDPSAKIKWGMQYDNDLAEDEISVVAIATDFCNLDGEDGAVYAPPKSPAAAAGKTGSAPLGTTDVDTLLNLLRNENGQ